MKQLLGLILMNIAVSLFQLHEQEQREAREQRDPPSESEEDSEPSAQPSPATFH